MTIGIMATKMGMTQIFLQDGVRVPVTVLQVHPNVVVAKKNLEKDGYEALQLGYGAIREKLVNKPRKGLFQRAGVEMLRHLREFRVTGEQLARYEVGARIGLDFLEGISSLDVAGLSKGKGFAGVMKRHHFSGFPRSHGTHEYFRHGGSIGMRAKPGKVMKGKRMAGHMGHERVTVQNLRVIKLMKEENLVLVRGAVPGPKGQIVELKASTRAPKALPGVGGFALEEGSKNPMKASKATAKAAPAKKK